MLHDIRFDRRYAVGLLWTSSVLLAGCAPGEKLPECAPVSGTVTLDGKPISNAMITFHPANSGNRGQSASDGEGKYTVGTYDAEDGAVVGPNTATVERYEIPIPEKPGGKVVFRKGGIPKKYNRPETSPLKFEVKSGQNNVFDLKLVRE